MFRVILIDDEASAIKNLRWDIANFCPELEVMESFTNPQKALIYLQSNKPDVVFLDIEMPKMDGFRFLEQITDKSFMIIFVTAYDQYAIKAINKSAAGYLLKPIDSDDLIKIVKKLKEDHLNARTYDILEAKLLETKFDKRVALPADGRLIFVHPADIIYCESDGNYSKVHLVTGDFIQVKKILKHLMPLLPVSGFVRVHNSYIINLSRVTEYLKTDSYLILDNDMKIPVARNRRAELLEKL